MELIPWYWQVFLILLRSSHIYSEAHPCKVDGTPKERQACPIVVPNSTLHIQYSDNPEENSPNDLRSLQHLKHLVVDQATIQEMLLLPISAMPGLINLSFYNASITMIPHYYLENSNVSAFSFENDYLLVLPTSAPVLTSNTLKKLSLSYNGIKELWRESFMELPKMDEIEMKGNMLETLPIGIFDNNRNLKSIDFENNRLFYVEERILNMPQLAFTYFGDNRWNCNCLMYPLAKRVMEMEKYSFDCIPVLEMEKCVVERLVDSNVLPDMDEELELAVRASMAENDERVAGPYGNHANTIFSSIIYIVLLPLISISLLFG